MTTTTKAKDMPHHATAAATPIRSVEKEDAGTRDVTKADAPELHGNDPVQIDSAFRRHYWLAETTGIGDVLDQHCRRSTRGRKKEGLSGSVFYALMLTAIFAHRLATIEKMHKVATSLMLDTRVEFGLVRYSGEARTHELTRKQLYTMNEGLRESLSYSTHLLTRKEEEVLPAVQKEALAAERSEYSRGVVHTIVERLMCATQLIDINHGTYAIDDSGIAAWSRGRAGGNIPAGGPDRPLVDEDTQVEGRAASDPNAAAAADERSSRLCPDAAWGRKSPKAGESGIFYGYKLHAIVNTNDPRGKTGLPILFRALELTPANADIVDVSLRLVDQIRAKQKFTRLIGDRHYGYKRVDRWAMSLWKRGIHQVLDLRADKPAPVSRGGALVIDGHLHCPATPTHLQGLAPDADNTPAENAEFRRLIEERRPYSLHRLKSPLASPGSTEEEPDPKVGYTRWVCPAFQGTVGCPLRENTVQVAREAGLPVVAEPPAEDAAGFPKCCAQRSVQIEPDSATKYV